MSDLDSTLAGVPHTHRPRVLVDHHSRIAERFVAEFKAGLLTHAEARELVGVPADSGDVPAEPSTTNNIHPQLVNETRLR
ncbi:hypothetical protein FND50_25235 [Rhodococcus sp. WB9]|uniref:hypothetical protein n=1 Tax=Rhodococcus sp. WB9 TaxID=2594007 RepID=UPI001186AB9E|nr:hypothetical protein [Rhodococcus sp. WB9]QDQ93736.1 hypothetical protein FND50_25235 [Rhodococcus sp. WB9]